MSPAPASPPAGFASFRTKLLVAMMLVVTAATGLGLFFAQRNLAASVRQDLERQFQDELTLLHAGQEVRHAALAERCHALAGKPRIHAALEDGGLDLLYPSARDELRDVMRGPDPEAPESAHTFHALFYRFLDGNGAVITSPASDDDIGRLEPGEAAQLALQGVPAKAQAGYFWRGAGTPTATLDEIIAMPIVSSETGQPIAALVLGFKPDDPSDPQANAAIRNGIWTGGRLSLPALPPGAATALGDRLQREMTANNRTENSFPAPVDGLPCLVFYKLLNPGSVFPPAYEVCIYPLTEALAAQQRLLWQFVGAEVLLLAGAFVASQFIARRLSTPVEQLAVDSEQNRTQREQAEAALELTHGELQRSARFSANASHQLKTPVTVLRAGLEDLLAGEKLSTEGREDVSTLVHQTFRLTTVIDDLLLLSRMDAGRLQLDLKPLDLIPLVAGWLDDHDAMPGKLELDVQTDFPAELLIAGDRGYTSHILQNLLENARKYNRAGGRIRIAARPDGDWAVLVVGNTGTPIPAANQEQIFERFHRGSMGENNPGHGLGLNLARELARLHQGDLRLVSSAADWTEFEVRFRRARGDALSPGTA